MCNNMELLVYLSNMTGNNLGGVVLIAQFSTLHNLHTK